MKFELQFSPLCLSPMLFVFAVQAGYSFFVCEGSFLGFIIITGILLIPAFFWYRASSFGGVLGACLGILPWMVWANHVECVVPYSGGGAAMAYVAVFLWGIPSSVACSFLFWFLQKEFNSKDED